MSDTRISSLIATVLRRLRSSGAESPNTITTALEVAMSTDITPTHGPDDADWRSRVYGPDSNYPNDFQEEFMSYYLPHPRDHFGARDDLSGWLRREIPALGARWLDVAELRLRKLVEFEQQPVPPNVEELLTPDGRAMLRLALLAQLTPDDLEPVPGGCEIPWSGCREHADMLTHRWLVPGWYCDGDERDHGEDTTFHRLRHCHEKAVAVLSADGHSLAVCTGHRNSELERGSYGGEVFDVIDIDQDAAA